MLKFIKVFTLGGNLILTWLPRVVSYMCLYMYVQIYMHVYIDSGVGKSVWWVKEGKKRERPRKRMLMRGSEFLLERDLK